MPILQADYTNLNLDEMAKSIGLNVKHMPILIDSFINESNGAITKLQNAIESMDFEEIHQNAHFIKGSAGNLKFNEIYEMSKEMEHKAYEKDTDFDYKGYLDTIVKALSTIAK